MNNALNAVNFKIGSLEGLHTAENLRDLLSANDTVVITSCLGGRLVVIRGQSLLINQLARDILRQNSSLVVCKALENLYVRSDKDVANQPLSVRAATTFRDGLMSLCGTNAIVAEKLGKAKAAETEMKAAKAKEINEQTQRSINEAVTKKEEPTATVELPTKKEHHHSSRSPSPTSESIMRKKFNHPTASEVAHERALERKRDRLDEIERKALEDALEAEAAQKEEIDLQAREKVLREKELASLKAEKEIAEGTIASLQKDLLKLEVGSSEERALLKQITSLHEIVVEKEQAEVNFGRPATKKTLKKALSSKKPTSVSTAPTTPVNSRGASPVSTKAVECYQLNLVQM